MEHSATPAHHIRCQVSFCGRADTVQAEFAKAGISAEVKPCLNWDVKTKLRSALQSWLQELGSVHASGAAVSAASESAMHASVHA
ncbi:TPA: hypothetical protein ACH3X1_008519 [Trebouxia sp. C0004]